MTIDHKEKVSFLTERTYGTHSYRVSRAEDRTVVTLGTVARWIAGMRKYTGTSKGYPKHMTSPGLHVRTIDNRDENGYGSITFEYYHGGILQRVRATIEPYSGDPIVGYNVVAHINRERNGYQSTVHLPTFQVMNDGNNLYSEDTACGRARYLLNQLVEHSNTEIMITASPIRLSMIQDRNN